eukprot:SAG11_NODE_280_length_11266_cov_28.949499_6_plen_119_part_00
MPAMRCSQCSSQCVCCELIAVCMRARTNDNQVGDVKYVLEEHGRINDQRRQNMRCRDSKLIEFRQASAWSKQVYCTNEASKCTVCVCVSAELTTMYPRNANGTSMKNKRASKSEEPGR